MAILLLKNPCMDTTMTLMCVLQLDVLIEFCEKEHFIVLLLSISSNVNYMVERYFTTLKGLT